MLGKLLCFFGRHEWRAYDMAEYLSQDSGTAICKRCGVRAHYTWFCGRAVIHDTSAPPTLIWVAAAFVVLSIIAIIIFAVAAWR